MKLLITNSVMCFLKQDMFLKRLMPTLGIIVLCHFIALSQDIMFTNYKNTPLESNPALVAFDNNLEIGLNYRGRISKVSQTYDIPVASVSCPLINHGTSRRWGGLGFSVLSDRSGNSRMIKTAGVKFAFAYNFHLTKNQTISASLGAGYLRRQFNLNHLNTGSQYSNEQGFDPLLPMNESFSNESRGYLDLSAGLLWHVVDNNGCSKAFFGFSGFHLNKPNISLSEYDDYLRYRNGVQLGIRLFKNENISVFPDFELNIQFKEWYYNAGVSIIIPMKAFENGYLSNSSICFRPRYLSGRFASLGFEFCKPEYRISFGYDFNISNKTIKTNMVNAYELSFVYTKGLMKTKKEKKKIIPDDDYKVGEEREF